MMVATKKWVFLKISSIILIPLLLWFSINLVFIYDKDFADIYIFFTSQPSKLIFSLLIVVAYFYSALSISEIFEDYIHDQKIKDVANILALILSIIIPVIIFNLLIYKI